MKKITAFVAGRKFGNTETLVKEALSAAREMGVDVEMIRLNDCFIQPCKSCPGGCAAYNIDPWHCVLQDDTNWLLNKFLDCDGFLLASPVYTCSPSGIVTVFRDRVIGPRMDTARLENQKPAWAEGKVRRRAGGLISVGGARTENWTSLGLPTLYTTAISPQTDVVDFLNVTECGGPGAATLDEALLEQARELGRHMADAVLTGDNRWRGGDKQEACPHCHGKVMILRPGTNIVECATCGSIGHMSFEDGVVHTHFRDDDPDNRYTHLGKQKHQAEIDEVRETKFAPYAAQARENLKKYRQMEDFVCDVKAERAAYEAARREA